MRPYASYAPDQGLLLPVSLAEAVDARDPVHTVRDVVANDLIGPGTRLASTGQTAR